MGFSDRVLKVLGDQNAQEIFSNIDVEFSDIDAGKSGSAGTVDIFPSTASKGKLSLTAADSSGDTTTTIVNASQAAARTYTIPDAGADASFVMTQGAQTIVGATTFSSTVTLGDGGTVTQATDKSTGVTLSTNSGQITMNNAALAAGADVVFTVTNTVVAATDVVIVNHGSAGTSGAYLVGIGAVAAGSFDVVVSNISGGSLSEAIVINFVVIGGASS